MATHIDFLQNPQIVLHPNNTDPNELFPFLILKDPKVILWWKEKNKPP